MPCILMCTSDVEGEGGEGEGENQAVYGSRDLAAILEKVWPYRSLEHSSNLCMVPLATMVISL